MATLTSIGCTVQPFNVGEFSFGSSSVTLGAPTSSCQNTIIFDKSQTSSEAENVTGCLVFDISGGVTTTSVEGFVRGTNFDPAGSRPIDAIVFSTDFDLSLIHLAPVIPTLTEWGFVALIVVLMLTGALLVARRRRVVRT